MRMRIDIPQLKAAMSWPENPLVGEFLKQTLSVAAQLDKPPQTSSAVYVILHDAF